MLNQYTIPLPDGTAATKTTPEWVAHQFAVIGLLKLKSELPPLNPDDKNEEPRFRRYQRWVVCATVTTQAQAERMAANPVYPEATLETRIVPIVAVPTAGVQSPGLAAYRAGLRQVTDPAITALLPPGASYHVGEPHFVGALPSREDQQVASGLLASLKQVPLEESNYVLPETQPDGSTKLIELQGVTFQSVTTNYGSGQQAESDLEPIDLEDL
jgi:hypothetical protein